MLALSICRMSACQCFNPRLGAGGIMIMDASLFQKILDRRAELRAELEEIDAFLRQAEKLASRLFGQAGGPPPQSAAPASASGGHQVRRWPQAEIGSPTT